MSCFSIKSISESSPVKQKNLMSCRDFVQATICHAKLSNLTDNLLTVTTYDGKDTILFNELIKKMPSKLKATNVPLVLLILNTIATVL